MKKYWKYIVFCLIAMFIGFVLGRLSREDKTSVETKTMVKYVPSMVVVRDTILRPQPYNVFLQDTVVNVIERLKDVDTLAILKDYYLTRAYNLDFSSDSLGTFKVDAEVSENRLITARSFINPIIKTVTQETTQTIYKVPTIQIWGTIGASPKLSLQKISLGVDIRQKYLLGVSGIHWDDKYNYTVDFGIKF